MKPQTRTAVAYIVGTLISQHFTNGIYDFSRTKRFPFSGFISPEEINVVDQTAKCNIQGRQEERGYVLLHYGENRQITFQIVEGEFQGIDDASGKTFRGSVVGRSITLFDAEQGVFFSYAL